jgi:hypothetical protein
VYNSPEEETAALKRRIKASVTKTCQDNDFITHKIFNHLTAMLLLTFQVTLQEVLCDSI